jgi:hypothetical protein
MSSFSKRNGCIWALEFVLEIAWLSGLPDGIISNQKSQFGYILEGLRMENVGTFYAHLEYVIDIWSFGNFGVIWFIFPRFGILCQEKSGNPAGRYAGLVI